MINFKKPYRENLPDCYKKVENSNNDKILKIPETAIGAVNKDNEDILSILDIQNATGKTLDLYGEMYSQARGLATDAQYRYMIKARIARNLAGGDYNSISNAICKTFNCDPSDFYMKEAEGDCKVELLVLPLAVVINAGFTVSQTVALVNAMLPVGVLLESYLFEGTFEFSDIEMEYSETAGFCDVEDGTLGGYFGILQGENEEVVLPI